MPAVSELRIPADPDYIIVAKRTAAGLGAVAGFGIESVDELCIAVAQACDSAIAMAMRTHCAECCQIRVQFSLQEQRLDVRVRTVELRADHTHVPAPALEEEAYPVTSGLEADPLIASDLALRVMGLFVDDCRYGVNSRTGGLRVRLTKYRVS